MAEDLAGFVQETQQKIRRLERSVRARGMSQGSGDVNPTPDTLVLRDANGRAKVADPSAPDDIDTMGARDAAIGVAVDAATQWPYIELAKTTTQSTTSGTYTTVTWDATPIASQGIWSVSSGAITIPESGYYSVDSILAFASATGLHAITATLNGTATANRVWMKVVPAGLINEVEMSFVRYFAAGAVLRIMVMQASGGSVNISSYNSGLGVPLTIRKVGERW